jgi:DNA-binding NarL/FixJ family response regulator
VYGAWLRRAKRKQEARTQLRASEVLFTELGAAEWAVRAAAGLRATGEAGGSAIATVNALTAQELRIAGLAAQGLSNKQIGERLALSHRTVGYHLRKVFSKLNITSRTQLVKALDG